ncbi:MAG: hypothetical protein HY586_06935, partial [Candidatus Omnitrophica bacterium]|nr:hypothetical protein [Candidatus Omnitrophota bacterium]
TPELLWISDEPFQRVKGINITAAVGIGFFSKKGGSPFILSIANLIQGQDEDRMREIWSELIRLRAAKKSESVPKWDPKTFLRPLAVTVAEASVEKGILSLSVAENLRGDGDLIPAVHETQQKAARRMERIDGRKLDILLADIPDLAGLKQAFAKTVRDVMAYGRPLAGLFLNYVDLMQIARGFFRLLQFRGPVDILAGSNVPFDEAISVGANGVIIENARSGHCDLDAYRATVDTGFKTVMLTLSEVSPREGLETYLHSWFDNLRVPNSHIAKTIFIYDISATHRGQDANLELINKITKKIRSLLPQEVRDQIRILLKIHPLDIDWARFDPYFMPPDVDGFYLENPSVPKLKDVAATLLSFNQTKRSPRTPYLVASLSPEQDPAQFMEAMRDHDPEGVEIGILPPATRIQEYALLSLGASLGDDALLAAGILSDSATERVASPRAQLQSEERVQKAVRTMTASYYRISGDPNRTPLVRIEEDPTMQFRIIRDREVARRLAPVDFAAFLDRDEVPVAFYEYVLPVPGGGLELGQENYFGILLEDGSLVPFDVTTRIRDRKNVFLLRRGQRRSAGPGTGQAPPYERAMSIAQTGTASSLGSKIAVAVDYARGLFLPEVFAEMAPESAHGLIDTVTRGTQTVSIISFSNQANWNRAAAASKNSFVENFFSELGKTDAHVKSPAFHVLTSDQLNLEVIALLSSLQEANPAEYTLIYDTGMSPRLRLRLENMLKGLDSSRFRVINAEGLTQNELSQKIQFDLNSEELKQFAAKFETPALFKNSNAIYSMTTVIALPDVLASLSHFPRLNLLNAVTGTEPFKKAGRRQISMLIAENGLGRLLAHYRGDLGTLHAKLGKPVFKQIPDSSGTSRQFAIDWDTLGENDLDELLTAFRTATALAQSA